MNDINVFVKISDGVMEVIGATHQMKIHVLYEEDLDLIGDFSGKDSLIAATISAFQHPPEIIRGDFNKFIENYINDEV